MDEFEDWNSCSLLVSRKNRLVSDVRSARRHKSQRKIMVLVEEGRFDEVSSSSISRKSEGSSVSKRFRVWDSVVVKAKLSNFGGFS